MSIFGKIRDAIFGARTAPAPAQAGQAGQPTANPGPASAQPSAMPQMTAPSAPVDVDAVLAGLARDKGQPSNYKTSIVDLMKLLDLDSSLANRQELATELGYTGAKDGSLEMNIWLHKAVIKKLEENGGKVSAELRD
jgi:hypothetical protein